jgi:lipoprotein-anchoring transpeptidase ErfK/SrfK
MPNDPVTIRPLGLGNILRLLGTTTAAGPAPTAPVAPVVRDSYRPANGTLQNDRFAGNVELEAIAADRNVLGGTTSPETVTLIQQTLKDMAFAVPFGVNGIYSGGTIQAIRNFQAAVGLPQDGSLGPNTLKALDRYAPPAGLNSWSPGADPGPIPSPEVGNGKKARVVVSVSQHRAFLFDRKGNLQKIYGVRTGREQVDLHGKVGHGTHAGVKIITGKNDDPTDMSNALWPESGGRAFGTRLLGLLDYDPATGNVTKGAFAGQELHGTYQDYSIGRDFSHGCVGMANQDIEEVFDKVRNGDLVNFAP